MTTAQQRRACVSPYKFIGNDIAVIKVGSNSLLSPSDGRTIDQEFLGSIAAQAARLIKELDMRVVIVSSGACAAGVNALGLTERPDSTGEKLTLSAVGQIGIITKWERAFEPHDLKCAQLLLTHKDFELKNSCKNLTNTLKVLFQWNIVPIVNENDPIAIEELTVGDNDRLSAMLAVQLVAKRLFLMTDINGLYDKDPRFDTTAKKIDVVEVVTNEMLDAAGGPSKKGRGGMRSKLESARFAAAGGVLVDIVLARENEVISRCAIGDECVGTRILPTLRGDAPTTPTDRELAEHRRWVACRQVAGTVMLRDEAVDELLHDVHPQNIDSRSITKIDGRVRAGDAVAIVDQCGYEIGRGVLRQSADEIILHVSSSSSAASDDEEESSGLTSPNYNGPSKTAMPGQPVPESTECDIVIESRDITLIASPSVGRRSYDEMPH